MADPHDLSIIGTSLTYQQRVERWKVGTKSWFKMNFEEEYQRYQRKELVNSAFGNTFPPWLSIGARLGRSNVNKKSRIRMIVEEEDQRH